LDNGLVIVDRDRDRSCIVMVLGSEEGSIIISDRAEDNILLQMGKQSKGSGCMISCKEICRTITKVGSEVSRDHLKRGWTSLRCGGCSILVFRL